MTLKAKNRKNSLNVCIYLTNAYKCPLPPKHLPVLRNVEGERADESATLVIPTAAPGLIGKTGGFVHNRHAEKAASPENAEWGLRKLTANSELPKLNTSLYVRREWRSGS